MLSILAAAFASTLSLYGNVNETRVSEVEARIDTKLHDTNWLRSNIKTDEAIENRYWQFDLPPELNESEQQYLVSKYRTNGWLLVRVVQATGRRTIRLYK